MKSQAKITIRADLLGIGVLASVGTARATTYYVATNGSDTNAGTSTSAPFLTLQRAAGATQPGDTVSVMSGTYTATCAGCDIVRIVQSGTASAPITYTAYNTTRPLLNTSQGWQAFHIDASYITVEGFEVVGNAKSVTQAQADKAGPNATYVTAGNGIVIEPISCSPSDGALCLNSSNQPCSSSDTSCTFHGTTPPNHVTIFNNLVHDECGVGIEATQADYITISNNSTYRNALWAPYGQSGISLFQSADIDNVTSYKNYVMNNFSYSNIENEPNQTQNPPSITDGNGIIIDTNTQTQYHGRTFVGNNVVSGNGGSGAHAFNSQHVDFVANTAYQNNQNTTNGQMFSYQGSDINFLNNIMTPFKGSPYMSNNGNTASVLEDYNLFDNFNISQSTKYSLGMPVGAHIVYGNPQFTNVTSGNFTIGATSAARGAATSNLEPTSDIVGKARPQTHGYDIGAYENTSP